MCYYKQQLKGWKILMENLVDIENYCNFLSSITSIDVDRIRSVVIIYFSGVANGNISFSEACLYIENELVSEMSTKKFKFTINNPKQKELAL